MTKVRLAVPFALAALLAACPPAKNSATCTGATVSCSGSCVDLTNSATNCGSCGTACPSGQSCAASVCTCPTPTTACGDLCSNTQTDALNCGACGKACLSGELCTGGECVCETGRTACAGVCVDLTSDVSDCGACGNACDAGQVCSDSACASYCAGADGGAADGGGILDCGGSCVDSLTDPTNCGGCGVGCIPGGVCSDGGCACGAGETACDGGCFDLTQNQQNCGACGASCASYQTCEASACAGPDLYVACSNYNMDVPANANSIVGINSLTGAIQLPAQPLAAPPPGGGAPIVPQTAWTLFTDSHTLWVLDTTNDQIDVLDVTSWPATVTGSIAVGTLPDQLLLCGGVVLVTNTGDNTVQGIDPTSMLTLDGGEVNVGTGEYPTLMACDGVHTVYVADSAGGDIKSIDVSQTPFVVGQTLAVPASDTNALSDGGVVAPTPNGIAYAAADGGEVLVSLENLDVAFFPVGPSKVLVIDPALSGVQASIDPGNACENGQFLTLAPAGSPLLETCTGLFYGTATTGVLAPIALPGDQVGPLVTVPLANPGPTTYLKNGLVAVGDAASGTVAIWNPADGGVISVVACPGLPDGGQLADEDIGAVVAAP